MAALGLLPAYSEPRATSAIPDILGFIGMVLDTGHAYRAGGPSTSTCRRFARFGHLSHLERDEMLELAAERGGQPGRPVQGRPAGLRALAALGGRRAGLGVAVGPGTSRVAHRVLRAGDCASSARRSTCTAGGATSSSRTTSASPPSPRRRRARRFVRHWMHVGMVGLGGEKMSKSLGNLVFVHRLLSRATTRPRSAWRCLSHTTASAGSGRTRCSTTAEDRLDRWRSAAGPETRALDDVRARLDDDLDTPGAIEAIDDEAAGGPRGRAPPGVRPGGAR